MDQFIFIIIILVILILFKINYLYEGFESTQTQPTQLNQNDGIYNYFYQQVLNPYKYPMIPFFSNDKQQLPKPNPPYPEY